MDSTSRYVGLTTKMRIEPTNLRDGIKPLYINYLLYGQKKLYGKIHCIKVGGPERLHIDPHGNIQSGDSSPKHVFRSSMLFHVSFQRAAQLEILIKTLVAIEIIHPHMILPSKLASFGDSDPPGRDEHKVLNCRWPRKCRTFLNETCKPVGQSQGISKCWCVCLQPVMGM